MKKNYINPEINVVKFELENIMEVSSINVELKDTVGDYTNLQSLGETNVNVFQ